MKTKNWLIIAIVVLSFNVDAQINKLSKRQVSGIQFDNQLKLPLLRAMGLDRYNENNIDRLLSKKLPLSTTTFVPKAYSSSSSALDVTLSAGKLRKLTSGVYFRGYHQGRIKIEGDKPKTFLGVYFRAKRNKTYRVKLKFSATYNKYSCRRPLLFLNIGETSQAISFKEGPNTLDFLIQSEISEIIHFAALSKYRVTCNGKKYTGNDMDFTFSNVRIQELTN